MVIKSLIVIFSIAAQFALFEVWERFYYRFEDRYNKYAHRLDVMPLHRIFDDAAFEALQAQEYGQIRYDTDEFGYREQGIDYDDKRGARFLFVGSRSIGYGVGVPADEAFAAAFGRELQRLRPDATFEVINGNREGATLEVTMHDLGEESFDRVDPDVVILGSYVVSRGYVRHAGDTVQDRVFGEELEEASGQATVKLNRTVVVSQVPHSRLWNEIYSRSAAMAKLLAHLDAKMADLKGASSSGSEVHASQIGYLVDLKAYLDARDIPLLIVILPQLGGEQNEFRTLVNQQLLDFADSHQVPLLSIDPIRPASSYTFVRRGHYSIESNRLVGGDLARWVDGLLDEGFQP